MPCSFIEPVGGPSLEVVPPAAGGAGAGGVVTVVPVSPGACPCVGAAGASWCGSGRAQRVEPVWMPSLGSTSCFGALRPLFVSGCVRKLRVSLRTRMRLLNNFPSRSGSVS